MLGMSLSGIVLRMSMMQTLGGRGYNESRPDLQFSLEQEHQIV